MKEDPQNEREKQVAAFVANLRKLENDDRARLKRNAGKSMNESNKVQLLFYSRVLPYGAPRRQEERYFLLATLYPLDKAQRRRDQAITQPDDGATPPARSFSSFGRSFLLLKEKDKDKKNETGLDRRFARLLDADVEDLPFQLRQAVTRVVNDDVFIDWAQLTHDVLNWDHAQRYVQRNWARDYVAAEPQKQEPHTDQTS